MLNVLVLQPIRPSNPPALRAVADRLLERMVGSNPAMIFDVVQDDRRLDIPPHPSLYLRHAMVRNVMLDTYLRDRHDAVLWVDSDLVDYPANLPTCLHAAAPGGICAPMITLDRWHERFYDIGAFVEQGRSARMAPPWFEQTGDVIELDSVGCCYLIPAAVYRAGVRYSPPPVDRFVQDGRVEFRVEHNSVMTAARAMGYRVCALTNVRAVHAWLPDYGLELN